MHVKEKNSCYGQSSHKDQSSSEDQSWFTGQTSHEGQSSHKGQSSSGWQMLVNIIRIFFLIKSCRGKFIMNEHEC